jgi:hypothetical protein
VPVDDGLRWALLNGYDAVDVTIHLADPAFRTVHELDSTRVSVNGQSYGAATSTIGAALWKLVRNADLDTTGRTFAVDGLTLPIDRRALRIQWSASADEIARRVLAGADGPTSAWTYVDGFEVTIRSASVVGADHHNLAPGTIVRHDDGQVVVQTGCGQVRVGGVHDMIGELGLSLLRPGLRFGIDPAEALRRLQCRVADMEQTVQWLANEWRTGHSPHVEDQHRPQARREHG